jgi:hypothetical protein
MELFLGTGTLERIACCAGRPTSQRIKKESLPRCRRKKRASRQPLATRLLRAARFCRRWMLRCRGLPRFTGGVIETQERVLADRLMDFPESEKIPPKTPLTYFRGTDALAATLRSTWSYTGLFARTKLIFCINRSKSMGLMSNSSQPAASAFSREPAMACAVKATTGMCCVA